MPLLRQSGSSVKIFSIRILVIFLALCTSALLLLTLSVLIMPRSLVKSRVCSLSLSRSFQNSLFSDVCLGPGSGAGSGSGSDLVRVGFGGQTPEPEETKEGKEKEEEKMKTKMKGLDITQLGSTSIHVVSLARRTDRREIMDLLKGAMNIDWTYFDALDKDDPLVDEILDWVTSQRQRVDALGVFDWPEMLDEERLDDLGVQSDAYAYGTLTGLGTFSDPSKKKENIGNSTDTGESVSGDGGSGPLVCAVGDNEIPTYLNASLVPFHMRLSRGMVACWYSHVRLIADVVRRTGASAIASTGTTTISADASIIDDTGATATGSGEVGEGGVEEWNGRDGVIMVLEDDVDMEWDLKERIESMWADLPREWDIIMLGHCWSNESTYPSLTPTSPLHPSSNPKCTHGYMLSPHGARRLLQHLTYPPFAFSRALDQAIAHLVRVGRVRSLSVVPSVVVQRRCSFVLPIPPPPPPPFPPPSGEAGAEDSGVGDKDDRWDTNRIGCSYSDPDSDNADGDSDIWVDEGRKGSKWRDSLVDGALERIWKGQVKSFG